MLAEEIISKSISDQRIRSLVVLHKLVLEPIRGHLIQKIGVIMSLIQRITLYFTLEDQFKRKMKLVINLQLENIKLFQFYKNLRYKGMNKKSNNH